MAKIDDKTKNTGTVKQPEAAKDTAPAAPAKRTAKKPPAPKLRDVDEHIAARSLPHWMGESIKVYAGWKTGREVSGEEFGEALDGWNKRAQGGGKR